MSAPPRAGAAMTPIAVAALSAVGVAALGGSITDIGAWYQGLRQPPWKPPDIAFAPAWTAIFALAAASGVTAWRAMPDPREREWLIGLFALNGALNVGWSLLFFRLQRPDWALIETAPFLASIVGLMAFTGRRSRAAAWLLAPYLVWVGFAAALNAAVVRLNGPFG